MQAVLLERDAIAAIAQRHVPSRRYWTVVGNGLNRIAANELRIKLSELCYRSISADIAEDKKHIDLCTEPLILVCAAGLDGSNADDVAKEVAYHRAHRAAPIVITNRGEHASRARSRSSRCRRCTPSSASCCRRWPVTSSATRPRSSSTRRPSRCAKRALPCWSRRPPVTCSRRSRPRSRTPARAFLDALRAGGYDGNLDASTAVRIASLLRYALGIVPLDLYEIDHGKVGTPAALVDDLTVALTTGIDELTRTIDTIKHQAKTVTVGISRADEELLQVPLVRTVLGAGASRDAL